MDNAATVNKNRPRAGALVDPITGKSVLRKEDLNHRMHIFSHRHNTHITIVQPERPAVVSLTSSKSDAGKEKMQDVLISMSAGNIGFKKAARGSYDAAFQLGAHVMRQLQDKNLIREIRSLEVILRGFGPGREAIVKMLLGTEGRALRDRITMVRDATRLKIGGTRSRAQRRL